MLNYILENWKDIMLGVTGVSTGLLLIGEKWRALLREPFKRKQESVASKDAELDYLQKIVSSQGAQLKAMIDENNEYFDRAEVQRVKFVAQLNAKDIIIESLEASLTKQMNEHKSLSEELKQLLERERAVVKKYREYTKYLEGLLNKNSVPFKEIKGYE